MKRTLDDAIEVYKQTIVNCERMINKCDDKDVALNLELKREEYAQLVEWLTQLKEYEEAT